MSNRTDWIARVYVDDEAIDAWLIEARKETEADVTNLHPGKDWTLHPAEEMEGGNVRVEIRLQVWIEAHAEAVHDVLSAGVQCAVEQEWDWEYLKSVVRDAVCDHLASRGVPDVEVDTFETYLELNGQDLVEIDIDVR